MTEEKMIMRNYEVRESTQNWLIKFAKSQGRATVRQIEVIIEDARKKDEKGDK